MDKNRKKIYTEVNMNETNESDFISRIKETRKNMKYTSAVSRTEPADRIPVNVAKLEELNRSIREKCRQNHLTNHNLEEKNGIYYSSNLQEQYSVKKLTRKY